MSVIFKGAVPRWFSVAGSAAYAPRMPWRDPPMIKLALPAANAQFVNQLRRFMVSPVVVEKDR
jgi:hypothetical protein